MKDIVLYENQKENWKVVANQNDQGNFSFHVKDDQGCFDDWDTGWQACFTEMFNTNSTLKAWLEAVQNEQES